MLTYFPWSHDRFSELHYQIVVVFVDLDVEKGA